MYTINTNIAVTRFTTPMGGEGERVGGCEGGEKKGRVGKKEGEREGGGRKEKQREGGREVGEYVSQTTRMRKWTELGYETMTQILDPTNHNKMLEFLHPVKKVCINIAIIYCPFYRPLGLFIIFNLIFTAGARSGCISGEERGEERREEEMRGEERRGEGRGEG